MALSSSKTEVLQKIVDKLPETSKWAVFGSIDHAIRGFDVEPNDIDVLATSRTAEEFKKNFRENYVRTEEIGNEKISSADTYDFNGEEVEVIYASGEQEPLLDLENIEMDKSNRFEIPLLPENKLVSLYEDIGKTSRAADLKKNSELRQTNKKQQQST